MPRRGVEIEHLPKYALELNPGEQEWNHARNRLAQLFVSTKHEIAEAIHLIP